MLVFFVCLILFFIVFLSLSIGVKIEDLKITNLEEKKKDPKVFLLIYIFSIKILSINIKLKDIKSLYSKERIKFNKSKIIKNYKGLKNFLNSVEIKEISLNVDIGVNDVIITTYIVVFLSTLLSSVLPLYIKEKKEKSIYKIRPIYIEGLKYKIDLNCIIAIKTVHIIHIIYLILKKRRDERYVRTSNRKSYESSYE